MWTCDKCLEQIEDQFDVCWNCGATRGGVQLGEDLPPSASKQDKRPVPSAEDRSSAATDTDADSTWRIWRTKTDEQVETAARALHEYTEDGEITIRAELQRRGLAVPPSPRAQCPTCRRSLGDGYPSDLCLMCGSALPHSILAAIGRGGAAVDPSAHDTAMESRKSLSDAQPSSPVPAAMSPEQSGQTAEGARRYKVVPFNAAVSSAQDSSHLASQVESIISSYASNGWEYAGVHQLQTFKAGSSGCFGLGATPPSSITTEFIVFRR